MEPNENGQVIEKSDESTMKQMEELKSALKWNDNQVVQAEKEYKKKYYALLLEHEERLRPLFEERHRLCEGLPDFWLTAMLGHPIVAERVQEWDRPVLKFLEDVSFSSLKDDDSGSASDDNDNDSEDDHPPEGFLLRFKFAENPFFTNKELVKVYRTMDDEFGVMLDRAEGTEIDWCSPDKDVTRIMRKKVSNSKKGKRVEKLEEELRESFFHFFDPVNFDDDDDDDDDNDDREAQEQHMEADFELGCIIRSQICKHAALFYAGSAAAAGGSASGKLAHNDDDEAEEPSDCAQQQQ